MFNRPLIKLNLRCIHTIIAQAQCAASKNMKLVGETLSISRTTRGIIQLKGNNALQSVSALEETKAEIRIGLSTQLFRGCLLCIQCLHSVPIVRFRMRFGESCVYKWNLCQGLVSSN